jgi:hypothetical protein
VGDLLMTLPSFLVIGAGKSGTTSLYYYLRQHPDIFMSPIKETRFFVASEETEGVSGYTVATLDEYKGLFKGAEDAGAVGEITPDYLASYEAPGRAAELIPDAQLVAILRNPVERAHSVFLHLRRDGYEERTDFVEVLSNLDVEGRWAYLEEGEYARALERWLEFFPRGHLRIVLYDDFASDPQKVLSELFSFVGVDASVPIDVSIRANASGVHDRQFVQRTLAALRRSSLKPLLDRVLPAALRQCLMARLHRWINRDIRKPELPIEARRLLVEHFRKDVGSLEAMLSLDLSHWLATPSTVEALRKGPA